MFNSFFALKLEIDITVYIIIIYNLYYFINSLNLKLLITTHFSSSQLLKTLEIPTSI